MAKVIRLEMSEQERTDLLSVIAVMERKASKADSKFWKEKMAPLEAMLKRLREASPTEDELHTQEYGQ